MYCLFRRRPAASNSQQIKTTTMSSTASNGSNNKDDDTMIRMSDYSYNLKVDSIARYPASPRGTSKLVRVDYKDQVTFYPNFSTVFPPLVEGCHLVFNDSHVLDARLFVVRNSIKMELMILDLGEVNLEAPCRETTLRAMIRTSHLNEREILSDMETDCDIQVQAIKGEWLEDEKSDGNGLDCLVKIMSDEPLDAYLDKAGSVPIPPYFQRDSEETDKQSYNNVYASASGSVAAPTAGLHFTHSLLDKIGTDNISFLTLHVGAGTFQPVLKEDASEHDMHAESFVVPLNEIQRILECLKQEKPLVVVGTTSCRTLESLYWCGVKLLNGDEMETSDMELLQFEWKDLQSVGVSTQDALQALVDRSSKDQTVVKGRTSLMIAPPHYMFRVVDHLVTNFHAPDSTLMLLVCAFLESGEKIRNVYHQAQEEGYRFLSYGDVCMFSRPGCMLPVDKNDNGNNGSS